MPGLPDVGLFVFSRRKNVPSPITIRSEFGKHKEHSAEKQNYEQKNSN